MPFGIGAYLIQQETVGATQVLLVTQAKTIGERIWLLLIQSFINVSGRAVDLGGAVQIYQILLVIDHIAEGCAGHAGFFHRHVITLVDQGKPLDLVIGVIIQNSAGSAHALGGVEVFRLLAINHQLGITLGNTLYGIAGIFFQLFGDLGPVNLVQWCGRCLWRKRGCRRIVTFHWSLAADEVGMQGNTK